MISITSSKPFVPVPAISKTFLQSGNSNQVKFPEADSFAYNSKSSEPKFSGLFDNLLEKRLAKALKVKVVKDDDGEIVSGSNRAYDSFHNFSFQDAWLDQVDFNHTNFSHGSNFQGCFGVNSDFSHSNLPAANFRNSILSGADFSEASLPGANFDVCDLQSLSILPDELARRTANKWGHTVGGGLLASIGTIGQVLSVVLDVDGYGDGAQTQAAKFTKAKLAGASFKNADLRGVDFTHSQLPLADFEGADARGADFTGAHILGANIKDTKLQGAKINIEGILKSGREHGVNQEKVIQEIGEILAAGGFPMGIETQEGAVKMLAINKAKQDGKITQPQLKHAYTNAVRNSVEEGIPNSQAGIYVIRTVYEFLERQDIF
jgi:uncharacterized protein YjbI with pentapeptide repeats